jgi:hypothetical protein
MCFAHTGSEHGHSQITKQLAADACPVSCGTCPRCNDSRQNGDEMDVDCGGSCKPCAAASTYGPIETAKGDNGKAILGPNMDAVCTGTKTGDTCISRPAVGFRPSTPATAAAFCSDARQATNSECASQMAMMFHVFPRHVKPGHFVCGATGVWQAQAVHMLPIVSKACPTRLIGQHYTGVCRHLPVWLEARQFTSTHHSRCHFWRSGVRQLAPTGSEEVATTLISVIRAADPETSAHHLGGTPHTAGLPQGR